MNQDQDNFNSLGPKPEFSTQPFEPDNYPQENSQPLDEFMDRPIEQPMGQQAYQQPMEQPMNQPMYQQPMNNQPNYNQMDYNQGMPQQDMYNNQMNQPMYQQYEQYDQSDYEEPKKNNVLLIVIGIVVALAVMGVIIFFLTRGNSSKKEPEPVPEETVTFEGEGYTFEHGVSWKEGKNGDLKALRSGDNSTTFLALTTSALGDDVTCNFDDLECRNKVYNMFYEIWISQLSNESLTLFKNDSVFEEFKDDINIAYFDFGKNTTRLKGRYIILVSKEKNAIVTFRYSTEEDVVDMYKEVTKMLSTIEIEEQQSTGNGNPSIGEYLDRLSSWNRTTGMRSGLNLSKEKNLLGGWLLLDDHPTYWKFEGNKFYWYQSVDVLDNNYWEGTFTYQTGRVGLESVGLDGSKIDIISNNSSGTVTGADVYSLILTPEKIISGGEDKTSTNLKQGTVWKMVWIVVNHGDEGVEAQVLNVLTSDATYYVKIIK